MWGEAFADLIANLPTFVLAVALLVWAVIINVSNKNKWDKHTAESNARDKQVLAIQMDIERIKQAQGFQDTRINSLFELLGRIDNKQDTLREEISQFAADVKVLIERIDNIENGHRRKQ